jgi:thioredoxin 1
LRTYKQVPVLIDFYTDWNESSIAMHPVIRDVAAALGDKAKKSLGLM